MKHSIELPKDGNANLCRKPGARRLDIFDSAVRTDIDPVMSDLDFYIETAERWLRQNQGGMPPQFIGPKLLAALHIVCQKDLP